MSSANLRLIPPLIPLFFTFLTSSHTFVLTYSKDLTDPVRIHDGILYGEILRTVENSKAYAAFRGIPYAKPPIGQLRFKPPQKLNPWNQPLYATSNESKKCIQIVERTKKLEGSEDCLYLNVYTPHTMFNDTLLKPVMVWIHGGSYKSGSSDISFFGPDFLVEEDVIVVTFNYRLGPFGFLNLHHEDALGNAGLKDQNLALKWVKKNIIQFGGDPDKITIFGQSAGAVSVDLHLLSDMSVGLFKQSIAMSGSPLCLWWGFQTAEDAVDSALGLAAKLGISTKHKDLVLKQLLRIPAARIINATSVSSSVEKGLAKHLQMPFRPTLESTTIAQDQEKFLTECTLTKYHRGNFSKGPHLMGFTSAEAVSFVPNDRIKLLRTIDSVMSFMKLGSWSLFDWILGMKSETDTDKSIQILSDLFFKLGIDSQQKLLATHNGGHPVYYYLYSFDPSPYSTHQLKGQNLKGAAHEDELSNLFYRPFLNLPSNSSKLNLARRRMVRLWTNFAKFSNPTPPDRFDGLLNKNLSWPNSGNSGDYLNFGDELTVTHNRPISPFIKTLQKLGFGEFYRGQDCPNAASLFKRVAESSVSLLSKLVQRFWP